MEEYLSAFSAMPFYRRRAIAEKIRSMYPDRVPMILSRRDHRVPEAPKIKYLVPCDMTLGGFANQLRSMIRVTRDTALFLLVSEAEKLVPMSTTFAHIYHRYANADGFVYISYAGESTFG
jgi:GABA(A) receptor-associated protein